jgi:hypothetical protein
MHALPRFETRGFPAVMIGSTDFLTLLADNDCHLMFEKGAPAGVLKRDFISLKHRDGRNLALSTPQGLLECPVELPRSIFDDFLAARLTRQVGPADENQRIVFNLTVDGVARGPTIDCDAQANVAVWDDPDENGLAGATVVFDGISFAEAVRKGYGHACRPARKGGVDRHRCAPLRRGPDHRGNRAAQRFSARLLM